MSHSLLIMLSMITLVVVVAVALVQLVKVRHSQAKRGERPGGTAGPG